LLENKVVELKIVDRASDSTIGRVLKNTLKPHRREQTAQGQQRIRRRDGGRAGRLYVAARSETSKQLIAETRVPIPMKPGRPARCDYEYERNGTANLS
jgi:hypothetical protein